MNTSYASICYFDVVYVISKKNHSDDEIRSNFMKTFMKSMIFLAQFMFCRPIFKFCVEIVCAFIGFCFRSPLVIRHVNVTSNL